MDSEAQPARTGEPEDGSVGKISFQLVLDCGRDLLSVVLPGL
jgi:hypothetical protein